jgi:hypothetical protein
VSHMVIFRTAEGKSGYHQAEALDEAVRFVERIRNEESVEQARIFRLEEVIFEFRPYYRVELTGMPVASEPPATSGNGTAAKDDATEETVPSEVADGTEAAAAGRKGIFR